MTVDTQILEFTHQLTMRHFVESFEKSIKTMSTGFSFMSNVTVLTVSMRLVLQAFLGTKPCCYGVSSLSTKRWIIIESWMIDSSLWKLWILEILDDSWMTFLKSSVTFALCHIVGAMMYEAIVWIWKLATGRIRRHTLSKQEDELHPHQLKDPS